MYVLEMWNKALASQTQLINLSESRQGTFQADTRAIDQQSLSYHVTKTYKKESAIVLMVATHHSQMIMAVVGVF